MVTSYTKQKERSDKVNKTHKQSV